MTVTSDCVLATLVAAFLILTNRFGLGKMMKFDNVQQST